MKQEVEALEMLSKKDTVEVIESPLVKMWLKEKAKRDPIAFCRLVQDNTERLSRIWGKAQTRKISSGLESFWLWEEQGVVFLISSSSRGTRIYLNYTGGARAFMADRRMGSAVTSFLERLVLTLSGNIQIIK